MFHVEQALRGGWLAFVLLAAAPPVVLGQMSEDAGTRALPSSEKKAAPTALPKSPKTPAMPKKAYRDPRTIGLGRSCTRRADCSSRAQVCLRGHDQRGRPFSRGFCALPCAGIEQGLTKTRPGFPAKDPVTTGKILERKPPPRCPARFQCRSKGAGVPIDMCVKE